VIGGNQHHDKRKDQTRLPMDQKDLGHFKCFTTKCPIESKHARSLHSPIVHEVLEHLSFRSFLISIGLALSYSQVLEGIKVWVDAIERIRVWVAGNPARAKEASKVWDEFLVTLEGKKASCSCSEQAPDETFKVHLKKAQWWKRGSKAVKRKVEDDDDGTKGKRARSKRAKR